MTPVGLQPTIPGSLGRCLIHWATGPPSLRDQPANQTSHAFSFSFEVPAPKASTFLPSHFVAFACVSQQSLLWGSNPWPYACGAHALPTELKRPLSTSTLTTPKSLPCHDCNSHFNFYKHPWSSGYDGSLPRYKLPARSWLGVVIHHCFACHVAC